MEELQKWKGFIRHSYDVNEYNTGYSKATFFMALTGEELLRLGWGHIYVDGEQVELVLKRKDQ